MVGIFPTILTAIFLLIQLEEFECQNKVYYVAVSSEYSSSLNGKPILEKSIIRNYLNLIYIPK